MYLSHSLTPVSHSVKQFSSKNCIFHEWQSSAYKKHNFFCFVHTVRTGKGCFYAEKRIDRGGKKGLGDETGDCGGAWTSGKGGTAWVEGADLKRKRADWWHHGRTKEEGAETDIIK